MVKIHIGCGKRNFGNDWYHIDGGDHAHLNAKDITSLHQFGNNTVDLIYASHVIEYFDREDVKELLAEWVRVLKPGGCLRLAVPDFETMSYLYSTKRISLSQILGPLYGKMNMSNNVIYHKTVYDFVSISDTLENCGLRNIKKFDWRETEHSHFDDHSQAYIPHMDKENGNLISLNVEAFK